MRNREKPFLFLTSNRLQYLQKPHTFLINNFTMESPNEI